jgi:outer membrane protein assembly factor BamB
VWQGIESFASQYATPIEIDGRLYGFNGRDDVPPAELTCLDRATGRVLWSDDDLGYGTLLAADGKLIATTTAGDLVLLRPNPTRPEQLARARPFADDPRGGSLRALPALAAGRLYLRNDRELISLDLAP